MSKSTASYLAYGCFLRRSQAMPEPRSITPVMPQACASSGVTTPMPTVRCFQMRLSVSRVSYSSTRLGNSTVKFSRKSSSDPSREALRFFRALPLCQRDSLYLGMRSGRSR
ncbi:hypothetical protein D3C71_1686640 [compost metagenome]